MHFRTMILIIFIQYFYAIKKPWPSGWEVFVIKSASQAAMPHLVRFNVQAYTMYYNSALHFVSMIVGEGIEGSEMRIKMCWPLLAHHQWLPSLVLY